MSGARLQRRRIAWMLMVAADVGLLAWGAMAALAPQYLLGPGSAPILPAGYEGFTNDSWQRLTDAAPMTAAYITMLFRMFGAYIVAFGVVATAVAATAFRHGDTWSWWALLFGNTIGYVVPMTYDWTVGAIGPFEMSEYLGLAAVYVALAAAAPFSRLPRPAQ
jgi:hypothetical protein